MALALFASCAYFNTFYNATIYYDTGVKALETAGASGSANIPKLASDAFGKAIEKSLKVIEKYPESRYVDDAFFIIGRSYFYRQEYGLAERYLRQLLQEYPWSPFSSDARIWLAKVHAQLGLTDMVEEDLAPILALPDPPPALLAEIYMLRGDIALRQGNVSAAITAFQKGAQLASDATQQSAIYYQLYELTEEQEDYAAALGFLDRYARTTPSESERINSRLTRVQLLQKMGDLEGAYKEIRNMVSLTEFASIIPGLQLELGKIELRRENWTEALNRFGEVIDEFATLPEASEAAYRAGEIHFTQFYDIDQARDNFRRVKRNTTYYQPAQVKLEQIATLKDMNKKITTLRSQLGLDKPAEEESLVEGIAIQSPGEEALPGKAVQEIDSTRPALDTAEVRQNLAYAMYRLGEIQLFEMEDVGNGLTIMADIVSNFDNTEVAAQAAYVLYTHTRDNPDQATFWRTIILEKYPTSPYGLLLSARGPTTGDRELDSLITLADEAIPHNPRRALYLFRKIHEQFGTEQSSYAIAYLYDEYLAQLDSAIVAYDEYLSLFPTGMFSSDTNRRLNFLRRIKAGLPSTEDEPEPVTAEGINQEVVTDTLSIEEDVSPVREVPEP
ncbi:MAG: tetratricopeptide repeat protein [Candidatus Neomarinimicrobiota bacterium]